MLKAFDGDYNPLKVGFLEEFLSDYDVEEETYEVCVTLPEGTPSYRNPKENILYLKEHNGTEYGGFEDCFEMSREEEATIREAFDDETGCIYLEYIG